MKKNLLAWVMLMLFSAAAWSCSEDKDTSVTDSVYLYTTSVEAPAAGTGDDGISVTVATTLDWKAQSNDEWITITPASGSKGFNAVHVFCTPNTTGALREGTVTFSAGTYSETLYVIQK